MNDGAAMETVIKCVRAETRRPHCCCVFQMQQDYNQAVVSERTPTSIGQSQKRRREEVVVVEKRAQWVFKNFV